MNYVPSIFLFSLAALCVATATTLLPSGPRLKDWWNAQSRRWMPGPNQIDQNTYDQVLNDELRQRIAPQLQELFPEQSTCEHCKWPWALVDEHATDMGKGRGVFVLCEHCWNHLLAFGREEDIRRYYQAVRVRHWPDTTAEQITEALDRDTGNNRRQLTMISSP